MVVLYVYNVKKKPMQEVFSNQSGFLKTPAACSK
jgi:hypothetical protein